MPWERFDPSLASHRRGRRQNGAPVISISRTGRFLLSAAAYRLLSKPAAARLLYDAEDRRIGFEAADVSDPHAYKIGKPALALSGASLLKAYGIPYEKTRRYQAKTQGKIVFIELGEHDGRARDS